MTWPQEIDPRIDIVTADENLRYAARVGKKLASSAPSSFAREQDVARFAAIEVLDGVIPAGGFFTILNPSGQQNNNGRLVLSDDLGAEIDAVSYGNFDDGDTSDNAPNGNANDVSDECLARINDGQDTDVDKDDFVKTECTFGSANNGEEVPPECVVDLDCGEDSVSGLFCLGGDVYETETSHSCVEEMCVVGDEDVLIEVCGELDCVDGECIVEEEPVPCDEDLDCDDGDDFTEDSCVNAGGEGSFCDYEPIECFVDSDCGEDGFAGDLFCSDGDVAQNFETYTCDDGGSVESSCSLDIEEKVIENCGFGCDSGMCLAEPEPSQGLTIFSPTQDAIYDNRIVLLDVLYGGDAKLLKYDDNDVGFRRLCKGCNAYSRTKAFSEGVHELMIGVLDVNGDEVRKTVNFLVDVRNPDIRNTFPVRGFTSGLFMVKFREMHPVDLFLNYGAGFDMRNSEVDLASCEEHGRKTRCHIDVDLSDFDGEKIMYWFELTDILGRVDESRIKMLDVDATPPVINSFSYEIIGRSLRVMIDITEDNFDVVQYRDHEDRVPRYRTLCSRLEEGICDKKKFFTRGEHLIDIRVLDKARNEAMVVEGLEFVV